MIAICDLAEGWSLVENESLEFEIRFTNGNSQRFSLNNFSFGWSWSDEKNKETIEWPPSNIIIRELSNNRVFSYSPAWVSDAQVTFKVWASNGGVTHTSEISFVVPRPPQPFPSWVWDGTDWQPPVPYPDGDGWYEWDEEALDWVVITEPDYEVE